MALSYKVGVFTKSASTGNQSVTGVGFQPKAVILFSTTQAAHDTWDNEARWGFGMFCATGDIAISSYANDNTTSSDVQRAYDFNDCYAEVGGDSASLVSLDSDGFTINWTLSAGATLIHYVAIGGSDASVDIDALTVPTSGTDDTAETGTGFLPTGVLLCSLWTTTTPAVNSDAHNVPAVGFTDGTSEGMGWVVVVDAANPSNTFRYQRTDKIAGIGTSAAGAVDNEADIVSLDADGFTVNYSTRPAAGRLVAYLAVAGMECKVGSFLQPTSTGSQAITGVGFQPGLVLFQSVNQTAQTTPQDQMRWSWGWTDGTNEGLIWQGSNDNVSPTQSVRRSTVGGSVILAATPAATAASTTTDAEAALTSLDSDGFTLNWTTADATQREILYMAFSASPAGSGGGTSAGPRGFHAIEHGVVGRGLHRIEVGM